MAENSGIEWTDHTFNPWWGCTEVSPGCDHCYARTFAQRLHPNLTLWGVKSQRLVFQPRHWNEPLSWNRKAEKAGRRDRVFCASMADVFDNQVDLDDERAELWTLIHKTPNLDWLLLTKRVANVARQVPPSWMKGHWPRNVWLGISVVDQTEADRDIPKLLALPARLRFLSLEPLLGPVNLQKSCTARCPNLGVCFEHSCGHRVVVDSENGGTLVECICSRLNGLHWVIVGGESGAQARPMSIQWARELRDQCVSAGVPFLFKQWGEWAPSRVYQSETQGQFAYGDYASERQRFVRTAHYPRAFTTFGARCILERVGKNAAGRQLDGRTWDEVPKP